MIKKKQIKDPRGGPGRNQGRKPVYNEATTTLAFRVPVSKKKEIKKKVEIILQPYQVKSKKHDI